MARPRETRTRHILFSLLLAMVTGVLGVNGYLLAPVSMCRGTRRIDPGRSPQTPRIALARALPKLALAIVGLLVAIRIPAGCCAPPSAS